jgi:hypothetical protein
MLSRNASSVLTGFAVAADLLDPRIPEDRRAVIGSVLGLRVEPDTAQAFV